MDLPSITALTGEPGEELPSQLTELLDMVSYCGFKPLFGEVICSNK